MKQHKVLTTGFGLLIALTGTVGLAACSDNTGGEPAVTVEVNVDIADDLNNARAAVADALAEDDSWAQIMLASDVEHPTVKYGLLVVPYSYSDAASHVQGTITIADGGRFTIKADSAATGETWQIDQDGTITQVTD
ncbi:MAG: hypothetical protein CVT64_07690 [Actinobacteria bacterium HGW-Actinobacteria-4]|nr:MAG: hypothetical protein CVT64_07690 [Actinobacteria bacterium HGW-Actinobacteria-4]